MKPFESLGLRFDGKTLWVLDQTKLPHEEMWMDGSDPSAMVGLIQRLAVRGAPLIGVAAAASLACFAERGASASEVEATRLALRASRPTAVNLMWALDRMKDSSDPIAEAEAIFEEDVALCERMANHGAAILGEREAILTHCNTGGLA
ncbi:MAG: S-methyl-5-thioribose-1-phosphate isomerase, partial [Acidobacteria bacterium]|nr:S-methyl-5-thioribose-1-phosphate isomerase [Acidobacteriota bacterium]